MVDEESFRRLARENAVESAVTLGRFDFEVFDTESKRALNTASEFFEMSLQRRGTA
jgi:hypothetical protein